MDRYEPSCLEQLKTMRKKVNWEIIDERIGFFRQLDPLFMNWKGQLPDLRDIFCKEEIEWLITEDAMNDYRPSIVLFMVRTGYKDDEPEVDNYGRLLQRRTSVLHHLAKKGLEVIPELFKIYDRFDVNYTDENGLTHFHVACQYGCEVAVKKFLEFGQDPNILVPRTGDSPLHLALDYFNERVIELLLRSDANPNLANAEGLTPLHIICKDGYDRFGLARKFFNICDKTQQTVQINAQDKLGNTPLHLALEYSEKVPVQLLLKNGADPNLTNEDGLTPLHLICRRDNDDLVKIFFEVNEERKQTVHVDARDKLGRTPLQCAVAYLQPNVIDVLFDHGADLSNFFFPTQCHYDEVDYQLNKNNLISEKVFKLRLTFFVEQVIELLEKRGYELNRNDALTIMKLFSKYELFEKAEDLEKCWYDDAEFATEAKGMMVIPSLSLYDFIKLQPKNVKLLNYAAYCKFSRWFPRDFPGRSMKACILHLCEKLLRGFFRRWALDFFLELTHYELPILCCEKIIDQLTNQDLYYASLTTTV